MLHEIFYWLLNMSIAGTLTGGGVWLLGRWKRLPRRLAHGLWVIAGLRLLSPVGFTSLFSVFRLLPEGWCRSVTVFDSARTVTVTNMICLAEDYAPFVLRTQRLAVLFTAGGVIWLTVLVLLLAVVAVTVVCNTREARQAIHLRDDVYLSDRIASPAVYGLRKPRILIPAAMADADLTHILAHERAHIRRRDNLWRLAALIIACLHWFNPVVWLYLRRFLADAELACDEAVLLRLSEGERRAYAHALVDAAQARMTLASPFGGAGLKTRILHVLTFRRMSAGAAVAFALFTLAFAWAFLTNTP